MRQITLNNPNVEIDKAMNLLLNMFSGLLPENLTKNECNLLKQKFGEDWFYILGYTDKEYNKPKF